MTQIDSSFTYEEWITTFVCNRWTTNKSFLDWFMLAGMLHGVSLLAPPCIIVDGVDMNDDLRMLHNMAMDRAYDPTLI